MDLAKKILNELAIPKPQRKFLLTLFTTILTLWGKVTFRNLSRYSGLSARTYARQFSQSFDFIGLNRALIDRAIRAGGARLIAFDPSFIAKAGKHTPGRAYFWNGAHRRAEKDLEVSAFSIVDLEQHTGFTLSIQQTQPTIGLDGRVEDDTLIDRYLHRDANMRFFYTGPPRSSGSGRQKTYDGKVDWQDLSRFDSITDQDGLHPIHPGIKPCFTQTPPARSRPAGFIGSQQAALCVAVFDRCGTGCGGALSLL